MTGRWHLPLLYLLLLSLSIAFFFKTQEAITITTPSSRPTIKMKGIIGINGKEVKHETYFMKVTKYKYGDGMTPSTITASGKKVRVGYLACSRQFKFGNKFYIPKLNKTFKCMDRFSKRFERKVISCKGKKLKGGMLIDIYAKTLKEARNFCKDLKVILVK